MSSSIQFFARLPIDAETHFIPKTSIFAQTPKWYQFKLRSLINPGKRWLGCLGEEFGFTRKKMIIADEGGVGKTKSAGKKTQKDIKKGKATIINLLGYENAVKYANKLKQNIYNKLIRYDNKANDLRETINFIMERNS